MAQRKTTERILNLVKIAKDSNIECRLTKTKSGGATIEFTGNFPITHLILTRKEYQTIIHYAAIRVLSKNEETTQPNLTNENAPWNNIQTKITTKY